MGVTLSSPNMSYDMGYAQFGYMRMSLCSYLIGCARIKDEQVYARIDHAYWEGMDERDEAIINLFLGCMERCDARRYRRLIKFALKPDVGGRLKPKSCKSIRSLMLAHQNGWQCDDDSWGYYARGEDACMTLSDLFRMLNDGIETGKGIRWS